MTMIDKIASAMRTVNREAGAGVVQIMAALGL